VLGQEITGDPARFDEAELAALRVSRLPTSLSQAVTAFEASPLPRAIYGEVLAGAVTAVRRGEIARTEGWSPEEIAQAYRWVF
jgi:glutamine synthetase